MTKQLLQQVLDALEHYAFHENTEDIREALREALNAPEPEPVAEVFDTFGNSQDPNKAVGHVWLKAHYFPPKGAKLYAAPPAAPDHLRDVAEKVAPAAPVPDGMVPNAGEVICPNCAHQFRAIPENVQSLLLASGHEPPFTASPAAPVVPLTDEQIRTMWKSSEFRGNGGQVDWFCEGIRAAEAHHGITGGKP